MSEGTPLYDHVGKSLEPERLHLVDPQTVQQLEEEMGGLSLASVHQLALMNEKKISEEYDKFMVAYALEWEEIVTSRLDKEIKAVQQLQRKRNHYEKKVSGSLLGLRKRTNNIEKNGKEVPPALAEKLQRNEQKLQEAFSLHENSAAKLCALLEEATASGWKDCKFPFLKSIVLYPSFCSHQFFFSSIPARQD
jgi:hypothetical protein